MVVCTQTYTYISYSGRQTSTAASESGVTGKEADHGGTRGRHGGMGEFVCNNQSLTLRLYYLSVENGTSCIIYVSTTAAAAAAALLYSRYLYFCSQVFIQFTYGRYPQRTSSKEQK